MAQFTDNQGETWTLELTIGTAKRVKRELQVDLLNLDQGDPPLIGRLDLELELMVDCISVILTPAIEQAGLTAEHFADRLNGTAIAGARSALWEALSDFFQNLGRPHMVEAIETQKRTTDRTYQAAAERIRNLDPQTLVDQQMAEAANLQTDGGSSTSSRGSSASTPTG